MKVFISDCIIVNVEKKFDNKSKEEKEREREKEKRKSNSNHLFQFNYHMTKTYSLNEKCR